jgi:methionine aminotransferase
MESFESKLPNIGTSIFTTMSALASEHKAINLGQGFPDFQMDETLISLTHQAMADGHNQYAPMAGNMALRESLSEKFYSLYNTSISPDCITITPGGTYAIYNALTTILNPGDEVIVFEPAYDSYIPNILVNGSIPVCIPLDFPDYSINWNKVTAAINKKTKAIIINSPHNPTGSVLSSSDMEILSKIIIENNLFLISDEVYEHLIFDNKPHHSVLKYPDLFNRSFVCFSFGKVYNCTGWKMGYCVAPPHLTNEFRKLHQYTAFSCHTPTQVALASHIKNKESYLSLSSNMQKKRDFFLSCMKNTSFSMMPSSGSYFVCASYENISQLSAKDFAIQLIKEYGVATIPVSAFYADRRDDKVLRFCFAKKEETLLLATERLQNL